MRDFDVGAAVDRSLTVAGRGRRGGRLDEMTVKKYGRYWTDAQAWLRSVGLSTVTAWSSETLAQYAGVLLTEHGYAVSTVDNRLSGVKAEHRRRGWPVPDGVAAWYVLRAAKSTAIDPLKVNTPRPRRADLAEAAAHLDPATAAGARDLCLATLGWDLMAGVRDLMRLDLRDVVPEVGPDGEDLLMVRLGDRWMRVEHLHEPVDVCPVEATQAWIRVLGVHAVTDGPLFRGVDKGGNIAGSPDPYAGHQTAERLTGGGLQRIWTTIAVRGNLPRSTPRDLRLASSLEAAAAGVPVEWILRRGGWSMKSNVRDRLEAAARAGAGEGSADGDRVDAGPVADAGDAGDSGGDGDEAPDDGGAGGGADR